MTGLYYAILDDEMLLGFVRRIITRAKGMDIGRYCDTPLTMDFDGGYALFEYNRSGQIVVYLRVEKRGLLEFFEQALKEVQSK